MRSRLRLRVARSRTPTRRSEMSLRLTTAGESHGPGLTCIIEGLPAGLMVDRDSIDRDLARRQLGHGRGGRMKIERDSVNVTGGIRHGRTLGGPIALQVVNRDYANWVQRMSPWPVDGDVAEVHLPRPGHADLVGTQKYGLTDVRDVLERASARETASRVAAGALGKVFLRQFGIEVRSHVHSIGPLTASSPAELALARDGASHDWWRSVEESPIRTGDAQFAAAATEMIRAARTAGDTLGGVFEVIAYGVPIGLGTYGQ